MLKKILFLALLATGPLLPAWAINNYMVENTPGTSPTGQTCYDFQTTPSCSAFIAGISSGSLPSGSTFYIQNSAAPTTATQVFSVSSGTFTTAILQSGTGGISGQVLTSNGAGVAPTWQTGTNLLPSTNTWTGGNTFNAQVTLSSNVVAGGSQGTAGQALQSNAGSAPTWVNIPTALLGSSPTFTSQITVSNTGTGNSSFITTNGGSSAAPAFSFGNSDGWSAINTHNLDLYTNGTLAVDVSTLQAVAIRGTTVGNSANPQFVGEYISSTTVAGGTNFPNNNTYGDLVSITLSAGDWDVSVITEMSGTVTGTGWLTGIGTVSGNNSTGLLAGVNRGFSPTMSTAASDISISVPNVRINVTGSTTYYLKAYALYSVGTPVGNASIFARRCR